LAKKQRRLAEAGLKIENQKDLGDGRTQFILNVADHAMNAEGLIEEIENNAQLYMDWAMTVTLAMKDLKARDFTGQNFENMRSWLGLGISFAPELRPESIKDRDNLARLVGKR